MKLTLTPVNAGHDAITFYLPQPIQSTYPLILAYLAEHAKKLGAIDVVPAYNSIMVMFDKHIHDATYFTKHLRQILERIESESHQVNRKTIKIPVCYEPPHGIDIEDLGQSKGLTHKQVIEKHTNRTYDVCCIGFIPGFAFMGYVSDDIAMPRHDKPRTLVPAGSVGIAGKQTGIYPSESPGGWRIIGRTPKTLYAPEKGLNSCFKIGDRVQFYSISTQEFSNWQT